MWIIHGYGRMGHEVAEIMRGTYDFCTVDPLAEDAEYAALAEIENFREGEACSALEGSVLIDFSCPAGSVEAVEWASKNGVCVLVATTGHTEEQMERIRAASRYIPVLCTGNTSAGVLATIEMLHYARLAMPDGVVRIEEEHHLGKADAPSGTAKMMAKEAAMLWGRQVRYGCTREKDEIGVVAVRLPNVVGRHRITISNGLERIEIQHVAHDRKLFAEGAIRAVELLRGKKPGLYGQKDLIAWIFGKKLNDCTEN